jgi:ribosome-binding factor A
MVSESRSVRIADRIKIELSLLFLHEISDPRLDGVNITSVELDREISYADIYISALDGSDRKKEILAALNKAGGFIRSRLDQIFAELDEEEEFKDLDE